MQIVTKSIIAITLMVSFAIGADRYSRDKEIVIDSQTGLQWQDDIEAKTVIKNWQEAIAHCEALTLGGHSDWRLPNIKELESIIDYGRYDPMIDRTYFQNVHTHYYWSSTTDVYFSSIAWNVHFGYGNSGNNNKSDSNYVRCVR